MANRTQSPSEKFVRGSYDGPGLLEQLSLRDNARTPDFIERKLEGWIPVFVYGSLRRGFHNHDLLREMPYLGSGYTTLEKYEMRESGSGGFPVVFEREPKLKGRKRNPVVGKVRGEIFVVDPKTLLSLDRLESNGRMYTRRTEWVFLEQQKLRKAANIHPSIKCWMYLGEEEFWRAGAGGQNTCKSRLVNGVRYYDWADVFETSFPASEDDDNDLIRSYGYLS